MKKISELPLGVSGSLFRIPERESYAECRRAGVRCVELCFDDRWKVLSTEELRREFAAQRDMAKAEDVRLWSLHLPFGFDEDPSALDAADREAILKRHIGRMEAAWGLGIQKVVLHGSYEPIDPGERGARVENLRDSLRRMADAAASLGMQIALEDLPRTCMGNTIGEMAAILKGLDKIGICCDTNHLLFDTTEDFIRAFGNRIVTLHISDYDRVNERHWFPGRGVNDWNAILAALEAAGYEGPALFELAVRDPAARPTCEQIRDCWDGLVKEYENATRAGAVRPVGDV